MREILRFKPLEKQAVWGSESWVIAAHPHGDGIISQGSFHGQTLGQLWQSNPDLFGNLGGECFPLLIKDIRAESDLSIQVHPDDAYARIHENGASGKSECWYILDGCPDARLILGHNADGRAQAEEWVQEGRWQEFLRTISVRPGDFIQIDAGCVHAICGGIKLLEIQQNSDITYRLYDYDRLSNGQKRALHIKRSLDVITYGLSPEVIPYQEQPEDGVWRARLVSTPFYQVERIRLEQAHTFHQSHPFLCISVIQGNGMLDGMPLSQGDHLLLPYQYGNFQMEGPLTCIFTCVPAG